MRIGQFVEYRGYIGSIEYDLEDKIYYGSLQNIKDSISYHAKYGDDLFQKYHEAVDRYIEARNSIDFGEDIVVMGN
jgi:predicted HicB family RNase H-like nuclease